jgi:flagellar biosynthesis GTPase FlhF
MKKTKSPEHTDEEDSTILPRRSLRLKKKRPRIVLSSPESSPTTSDVEFSSSISIQKHKTKHQKPIRKRRRKVITLRKNAIGYEEEDTVKKIHHGDTEKRNKMKKDIQTKPLPSLLTNKPTPLTTPIERVNEELSLSPLVEIEPSERELAERMRKEIQATLEAEREKRKRRLTKKNQSGDIELSSSLPSNFSLSTKTGAPSLVLQIPFELGDLSNSDDPDYQPDKDTDNESDETDNETEKAEDGEELFGWNEEEKEYWGTLTKKDQVEIRRKEKEVATFRKLDIPGRFLILQSPLRVSSKAMILQKLEQLEQMETTENEYFKLQKFVDGILRVPFGKTIPFPVSRTDPADMIHHFLNQVAHTLHECIYGHAEAKERLLQFVAQSISNPRTHGHCIALCGPPGVGKTSLVKNGVAKALGRPFSMLALGGASDSTYLEGHHYTYEGSQWGRIVDILIQSKCMNPVIFFDELDKVSETKNGEEIIGVLTHLTDPTQNQSFQDKYFGGVEFDVSKCLFIFSLNDESKINTILKDRMTVIHVKGFDREEKMRIGKDYLIPELMESIGFRSDEVSIPDETWKWLLSRPEAVEPGVRSLRRLLETILLQLNVIRWFPEALHHGSIAGATAQTKKTKAQTPPGSHIEFPFVMSREWAEYFVEQSECDGREENPSARMMYL